MGGQRPSGWLGPYLAQTPVTLDLLKEAGYDYVMDWPADDQPFWMRTRSGPLLSVPYSIELNDSPAMVFRQQSARSFEDLIVAQFVHDRKRVVKGRRLEVVLDIGGHHTIKKK